MRHHCKASAIPSTSVYHDLDSLDWTVLIQAMIRVQPNDTVEVVHHHLQTPEEELLAEPMSFVDYVKTLPLMSQHLLYHVRFIPGGERTLRDCLIANQKLHAANDGSLDSDAELALLGWHLIGNGNVLVQGAGPVDGIPKFSQFYSGKIVWHQHNCGVFAPLLWILWYRINQSNHQMLWKTCCHFSDQ